MILLTPIVVFSVWLFSAFWLSAQPELSICSLLLAVLAVVLLKVQSRFKIASSAAIVAIAALVAFRAELLIDANNPISFAPSAWNSSEYSVTIDSEIRPGSYRATVLSPVSARGAAVLLQVGQGENHINPGCRLHGEFRLVPQKYRELSWALKQQGSLEKLDCGQRTLVSRWKSAFEKSLRSTSRDAGALVAGLAIGDDSKLSIVTKQKMQSLSLTHLTAVSGANCAIVIGIVIILLRRFQLSKLIRVSTSLLALLIYVNVVGPEPSVLRAATMTAVLILCALSGRPIRPFHSLSLAALILLLNDPFFAIDLGFALSVAATFGLLTVTPMIYRKLRTYIPAWLAGALSVSAAAQLWCLPLLLTLQGGLPTYSLVANALAEPLVAPITVLGLAAFAFSPLSNAVAGFLSWIASLAAEGILFISENLTRLPALTFWWPSGIEGVVLLCVFAAAVSLYAVARKSLAGILMVTCIAWLGGSSAVATASYAKWPVADWQIVNCDVGQGDALVIRSGSEIAVVDVGREDKPIDECLDRLGVHTITLLVLTHFDLDHVGGLTGAIEGRTVGQTLLTEFDDERPQVEWFIKEVEQASPVSYVHAGMQGSLGSVGWTVLQPESGGAGSEDSNDGSIAMRWDAPNFTLFTMADLGAKGQMRLVENHASWIQANREVPLILKVSHHGSADQYPELIESWKADVALISVGASNPYGHPTKSLLKTLEYAGSKILRTDHDGAISLAFDVGSSSVRVGAGG